MSTSKSFLRALQATTNPPHITFDEQDIAPWLTDWRGHFHGACAALVSPANTAQLSCLVALAAHHGVALVPQGGNSGMAGGATPDDSGEAVLLSLRKMAGVRAFNPADRHITVEAGMVLQNLHALVEANNLRFPLTLGGKGSATIGGLISTNAGGTQVLRHGNMRALVEGIEAVLPDGSIYDGLTPLKKDNRGYDLKHLLIGAEGTLGVVSAATLRLVPAIIQRCVLWAGVPTPQAARQLLLFMQEHAKEAMEGFEIIPQHCLDNVLTHIPGTKAPLDEKHAWHCLIEYVHDQQDAGDIRTRAESLAAQAFEQGLIANATLSANESQAEAFWKIRDSISEAERADGPAVQHDISVPVPKMADFISHILPYVEERYSGVRALAFGHMGDGNVHLHAKAPKLADHNQWDDWAATQGAAISAMIHDQVIKWDGSISAEHGIGQMKRAELGRLTDPARLRALAAIKNALDPKGIMNPGKLIPLASERMKT